VRLEIGEELQFDIGSNLETFLSETLQCLQQVVEGEELQIIALLEEFVDEQVQDRIAAAREKVAAVLGRGTTVAQTAEVRTFYAEVRSILKEALKSHVRGRFERFGQHLTALALAVPDKTLSEVGAQIERTSINIRAAAEAMVTGQKDDFERISSALASAIATARTEISALLQDDGGDDGRSEPDVSERVAGVVPTPMLGAALSSIQQRAAHCMQRHTLQNGAKGWPWGRIFPAQYLRGATQGWLIDPYLVTPFQRRNLGEFVMTVLEGAKLKTLNIITREVSDPGPEADKQYFDALDRDAFEKAGMRVVHTIDRKIHDRSFSLDNGFVFKLGRGLDIYKPCTALAARDSSLRQVRPCEIDVFGPRPT
jgi:hypothetical protein